MEEGENIPQKKSVLILVLLSIVTLGVYPAFWYFKRVPEIDNLGTDSKLKKWFALTAVSLAFLFLISLITLSVISFINYDGEIALSLEDVPTSYLIGFVVFAGVGIFYLITMIMISFNVRKILNEALVNKEEEVKVSGFYTFFFNFLYLQYEINRITDDKEKENRTGPLIAFVVVYLLPLVMGLTFFVLMTLFS